MADSNFIPSYKTITKFFCSIVQAYTSIPKDHIMVQYNFDGAPTLKITDDGCFIRVENVEDVRDIYKHRSRAYNAETFRFSERIQTQRTIKFNAIFYGPNCDVNAHLVSETMFFPEVKYQLDRNKLYLVPDMQKGPYRMQEEHNGQWYERVDYEAFFYTPIVVFTDTGSINKFNIITKEG